MFHGSFSSSGFRWENAACAYAIRQRSDVCWAGLSATDPQLSGLASIVVLKEEGGDRVRLDVVSPHHFERTAAVQAQACGEAAQAISCSIDVNLSTHWPMPRQTG
jgi:hypothetical protein